VQWLGYEWSGDVRYASDYFQQLYDFAVELIQQGKAYVCSLSPDDIRSYRGTLTAPGKDSPYRDRPVDESLALFSKMKAGEFKDGEHCLRAKIDMASPNINLRDPILYRIRHISHHQTGDQWCIYPMYDYTHCISDALEGITHSLCTLEFEDHRPLYDWVLDNISIDCHPQQIEFARLNLNYTVTSKRKLKRLVDEGLVSGWDDPRMSTISGFRRRGYTPLSIRNFCERIGVTKVDGVVDIAMLEHSIREDLDNNAPRAMCVLDPLKVVISNYPEDQTENLSLANHPKREELGSRTVPFAREVYIERADFQEVPQPGYKRLKPDGEVRLRGSYVIKCNDIIKDDSGTITELHCSYDDATLGKKPEGRKVKGVVHWVPVKEAIPAKVRLYDRLFNNENPDDKQDSTDVVEDRNPASLIEMPNAVLEPSLAGCEAGAKFQFERQGYFCLDSVDSTADKPVFNRTVTLKEGWKLG